MNRESGQMLYFRTIKLNSSFTTLGRFQGWVYTADRSSVYLMHANKAVSIYDARAAISDYKKKGRKKKRTKFIFVNSLCEYNLILQDA